ncbi:hypothetical protein CK203_107285 [Vitis vinifera]|uniref:Uncharacterized protein n=1 Tax=Vitis vinifera TaxID=29760 RepID=A0A438DLC2_VITVI|nr:hypothetical protein CK203_107285 [Vitis vinifera]
MDTQQSRHVVFEDTPSDLVTPPVLLVQMPVAQTLHTISHDQAVVIPPIVTSVTIVEDPRSHMDRLERRIKQMRDPNEMISWDDIDDVPMATLPMRHNCSLCSIVIERHDTEMVRFIRVISLENLGGLSTGVFETIFIQWFARHLTGVPFQDFRSLVQALFDVDDDISRGLWSDITPFPDTKYPGVISYLYNIVILIPLAPRPPLSTLPSRFRAHEFCAFHQMADIDLGPDMTVDSFPTYSTHAFPPPSGLYHHVWTPRALIFTGRFDIADLVGVFWDYIFYFSVVTGPRAEIDSMMVMIQSTLRLDFFRLSLFVRVSIIIERSSKSSDVFIATFDFTNICYFGCLTSTTSPTFSAPATFLIHCVGYVDTTSIPTSGRPIITASHERLHPRQRCRRHFSDLSIPLSRVFETFQAMGFLAPLAPRAHPDPVPSQFDLIYIVRTISQQDITMIVALLYDMPYRTC